MKDWAKLIAVLIVTGALCLWGLGMFLGKIQVITFLVGTVVLISILDLLVRFKEKGDRNKNEDTAENADGNGECERSDEGTP